MNAKYGYMTKVPRAMADDHAFHEALSALVVESARREGHEPYGETTLSFHEINHDLDRQIYASFGLEYPEADVVQFVAEVPVR